MASLEQTWNPELYDRHAFVWQYGESLLELLDPQPQERILDLGCGLGQLSAAMAERGAVPLGLDSDAAMVAQARQRYRELAFAVADARDLSDVAPVDAIFSNAVLHWIPSSQQAQVAQQLQRVLRPGGRLVLEMGGKGCVHSILEAITLERQQLGWGTASAAPWHFPSLGEQTKILEDHGFEVSWAALFDRPTPLAGEAGLASWIAMFAGRYLRDLSQTQQQAVTKAVAARLRPTCFDGENWVADYRRLRIRAVRLP